MRSARVVAALAAVLVTACVKPTQFDRYMTSGSWIEADREYRSDPKLRQTERGAYEAGLLYGTPGIVTYDPARARTELTHFLALFPDSDRRTEVRTRLRLIEEVIRNQQAAAAREKDLDERITALSQETRMLRARIDSTTAANDSLRAAIKRLEDERKDRDEQIKALRLELQRLKEIDLKPRTGRPSGPPR